MTYEEEIKNVEPIERAKLLCYFAHLGQFRKYNHSNIPYYTHPFRVAADVEDYYASLGVAPFNDISVIAAYLHDVVEDTQISLLEIDRLFNNMTLCLIIHELTNQYTKELFPELNRAQRKAEELKRIQLISHEAKIIKFCDRIDNLKEMNGAPEGFEFKYKKESLDLAEVLRPASEKLYNDLVALCKL